jgi:ABC-2 type transport system permease protein
MNLAVNSPGFSERVMTFNFPIIKKLVYKDLYLIRKLIAAYIAGIILSLSLISLGEWQFYMGAVLFISMVVGLGNHQLGATLINERKEQTLSFVMSLPVSPRDYAMAKLLSTVVTYFIPWLLITISMVLVIWLTPMSDGLIPFTVIVSTLVLLHHCITWSAGMALETEGAVLATMIGLNCVLNPELYFLIRIPEIYTHINTPDIVWAGLPIKILLLCVAGIFLVLSASFYFHARKKSFY